MINRKDLDVDTQIKFDEILNKDVSNLRQDEIDFLKARKDYLTKYEIDSLSEIFGVEKTIKEAEIVEPKKRLKASK